MYEKYPPHLNIVLKLGLRCENETSHSPPRKKTCLDKTLPYFSTKKYEFPAVSSQLYKVINQ